MGWSAEAVGSGTLSLWIVLICIASCSNSGTHDKSAEQSSFKASNESEINALHDKFLYEKTVCNSFVSVLAEDPEFISTFESLDYRRRNLSEMLTKRKIAQNEAVRYVLTHMEYFDVDVDFHGGPSMTYAPNSSIFCAQSRKRLNEIEARGPSMQAWAVREYFLDLSLENLLEFGMPGYEGPVGYDFESLKADVETAKTRYLPRFKVSLKNWIDGAAKRLRGKARNSAEEAPGKKEQAHEIEKWITVLKSGMD